MADARIRVLIVDDHEMVREGLMAMLQPEPDFEVVGQTGYGAKVVDLVESSRPDVVLLDARLPDVSGVEVCRRLTRTHPRVAVVILTTYTDSELVQECLQAGARGVRRQGCRTLQFEREHTGRPSRPGGAGAPGGGRDHRTDAKAATGFAAAGSP